MTQENLEKATFAGGCFWCTEAVFKRLKGVYSVMPGYSGGKVPNPTYEDVSGGNTGYAEAIQIEFDPKQIPFEILLDVFWASHDPTTLNRQGNDVGTQYRSAIFYHNPEQKKVAEESIKKLSESGKFNSPIVTEVAEFTSFFVAEEGHRDFYDRNRDNGYCRFVIDPKIQNLYKDFQSQLKEEKE